MRDALKTGDIVASPTAPAVSWGPTFLRRAAAWIVALSIAVGALGITETSLLLRDRYPFRVALGVGAATLAIAHLLSLFAAPLLAAGSLGIRRLRRYWLVPIVAGTLGFGWWLPRVSLGHKPLLRAALALSCALSLSGLTWLSRTSRRRSAMVYAALIWGGGFVLDLAAPSGYYPDLHLVLGFLMVGVAVIGSQGLRQRIRRVRPRRLLLCFSVSLLVAGLWSASVESVVPGWRAAARSHGRYAHRMLALVRGLVDFDSDGFSSIAWGGDCDDLDGERHPLMNDRPGGPDRNCNGVVPPIAPSDGERGLAPPAGEPDLPAGACDLTLLVTIDCWRADAFLPEAMPRLSAYAKRGVVFSRSYSGATSTGVSTKLMQRVSNRSKPIAELLADEGVSSTAVLAIHGDVVERAVTGFQQVVVPDGLRWSAPEASARAIADLDANAGRRHYLWLHFFDAHTPYEEYDNLVENTAAATPPSYPQYVTELNRIDTALGILLDHLEAHGQLGRAVVIVTGDHGEGFGEHDVMRHHVSAYEAVVRVPAVVLAPGLRPGRVSSLVSGRDLPPTVLGAFGLVGKSPAVERYGRSWLRLRDAPSSPLHRFVAIRSGREASGNTSLSPMLAIVEDRYKLVRALDENLTELYDVVDAPGEERDLTSRAPEVERRLLHDLELYRDIDKWPEWPPPIGSGG